MRTYRGIKTDIFEQLLDEGREHASPIEYMRDLYKERIWEDVQGLDDDDLLLALSANPEFLEYGARPAKVTDSERDLVYLCDLIRYMIWEDMAEEFYDRYLDTPANGA